MLTRPFSSHMAAPIGVAMLLLALLHRVPAFAADYADWVTYQAEDGSFTLEFPVEPNVVDDPDVIPGLLTGWSVNSPGSQYSVQILQWVSDLTPEQTAEWLEKVQSRLGVLRVEYKFIGDIAGVEVLYSVSGAWILEWHYVHGQRVYTLRAAAVERNDNDLDANYFLDSFALN